MSYPYFVKATGACAVCAYWGGNRQRINGGITVDSELALGMCQNKTADRYNHQIAAGRNDCNKFVAILGL